MPAADLRKLLGDGKCLKCHGPLGHVFWRVRFDRGVINVGAARRQLGLAQFLGSDELAQIMGPSETMVAFTGDESEGGTPARLCDRCFMSTPGLAELLETANEAQKAESEVPA